jgi:undecaprenyl-diphosphatase
VDFTVFHFLNGTLRAHDDPQDLVEVIVAASVPLFAVATALLWLLDRPGAAARFQRAALLALASAGLALLVDQVISHVWIRERPFAAHPHETVLLVGRTTDPSFPSDHASAAFAIAVAVFLVSRRLGALFLLGAAVVALSRVFAGVHYPGDVGAGALIGLAAALLVTWLGSRTAERIAIRLSVLTDPLVAVVWRAADALAARLRPRPAPR